MLVLRGKHRLSLQYLMSCDSSAADLLVQLLPNVKKEFQFCVLSKTFNFDGSRATSGRRGGRQQHIIAIFISTDIHTAIGCPPQTRFISLPLKA